MSILFGTCPVCGKQRVNRLAAVFVAKCGACGCKLKQFIVTGVATQLVAQALVWGSISLAFVNLSVWPVVIGIVASLLITSFGIYDPDLKDPETKLRMRMVELERGRAEDRNEA